MLNQNEDNPKDLGEPKPEVPNIEDKEIDSILIKDDQKIEEDSIESEIKKIENSLKNKKSGPRLFRGAVITAVIGIVLILSALVIFIFKLDALIFPSSVSGKISDYAARPLTGAEVCVHASCTVTDNEGLFIINNLAYGTYEVSVEHENFFPIKEEIILLRGEVLLYNKELSAKGVAELAGNIQTKDGSELVKDELIILIGNKEVPLFENNNFILQGLPKGDYTLIIKSPSYLDYILELRLDSGLNTLDQVLLEPGMDIYTTTVDWFSGKVIPGAAVMIGSSEFQSDQDGKLIIKDLQLQSSLTFNISKEGYNVKKTDLANLKQGKNTAEDQKLVIEGRLVFVSNRTGNQNLYSIDYDGSNETPITSNNAENYKPVFSKDFKSVYFLTTKDGVKDNYGSTIALPYSVNLFTGSQAKLSKTNYSDYGSIGEYNYKSMKRAFVKYLDISKNEFYFGNLDGGNTRLIGFLQGGSASTPVISNDGKFILFTWNDYYQTDNSGIYHLSTETLKLRKIFTSKPASPIVLEMSNDNQSAIIDAYDNSSQRSDIWVVNIPTGNTQRLTNSATLESAAAYSADNRYILYLSDRDGKSHIYRIDAANGGNETVLTSGTSAPSSVTSFILGPNNTVLYINDNSLWLASIDNSFEPKKVKDNVSAFDYSEYGWIY